jgi:hypothetical protein
VFLQYVYMGRGVTPVLRPAYLCEYAYVCEKVCVCKVAHTDSEIIKYRRSRMCVWVRGASVKSPTRDNVFEEEVTS